MHETEYAYKILAAGGGIGALVCGILGMVFAAMGSEGTERYENIPKGFLAGVLVGAGIGLLVAWGVIS